MCGIAGFLIHSRDGGRAGSQNTGSENVWEVQAQAMIDAIAHRGPNGQGLLLDPPLYLGNRRLAILDPSPDGQQPMGESSCRYWISYNGEIYNYLELRKELQGIGISFSTRTDTEVLLHAYRQWGRDMLHRLDGMFAFAIWDRHQRSLWLARDAIGIKPLFYSPMQERFLFASEIKAILAASIEPVPDRMGLGTFLHFGYTSAPATGFQGISQLLPGHEMTVESGNPQPTIRRWYRWPYPTTPVKWSRWESADRLRESIHRSVAIQLRSDVPVGAFLSGGLDSSSLVAAMANSGVHPLHTFSVAMDSGSFDESEPARAVADLFGTQHHAPRLDASRFDRLIEVVRHAEDPIADNSLLPTWLLCESTSKHVSVALSGDGADELLGGYATYRATELARIYRRLPRMIRKCVFQRLANALPASETKYAWSMLARRFTHAAEQPWPLDHASWRLMLDSDYSRRLRSDDWSHSLARSLEAYTACLADIPPWIDLSQRMLHMDLAFHLSNDMLVKVDRMSMAHGLEVRVPFLGRPVLETALAIPSRWKRSKDLGKLVLRDAMRDRLPRTIVERKKAGFVIPIENWLRGPWHASMRSFLTKDFCDRTEMLHFVEVDRMMREHASRSADHAYPLFTLLVMSIWWDQWMKPSQGAKITKQSIAPANVHRLSPISPNGLGGVR